MALLLTDTQKVLLSIQPVDAKGYPAKVDGVPAWDTSDPTVVDIVPSVDGLSCEVFADAPGIAQVTVQADADLGSGVRTIAGTLDIQVEPGEAVGLTITAGVPEQA